LAKKFILGVELLTGLAIGAAAAAAAVSFMIVFLVDKDIENESAHMATVTAHAICNTIDTPGSTGRFSSITNPLVRSGSLEAAVILDPQGNVIASEGLSSDEAPVPGEGDGWYYSQCMETGYLVGIMPSQSSMSAIYRALLLGLATLTAALLVLAFFTPRYLARTVISPLRDILTEADRFTIGGGTDPEAAGASFHRLVELLHIRDQQLNELRKRAEQRADRVEKRSATILSVLGSAVFSIDGKGNLLLYNDQSGDMFELTHSDTGKEFPWERTESGRHLKPILLSLGKDGNTSAEFQISDEETQLDRMFSVVISRSRAEEIAVLVTDVTRISELERKIADQSAMADIGAASAGISHEMGNTLCALSGFVDLLARGHSDERTLNIISEVRREVDSAQDLINSFGSFAQSPEPVSSTLSRSDVSALCREASKIDEERCSISISEDDFSINADSKLLSSCICNIVRNAVEADTTSLIEISLRIAGANLLISVSDNGPGLSIGQDRIFRPFMTTKNRSTGNMGLGLSVSRRIIRSMGGELSAADSEEGGALFTIQLPLQ